jgi:dUTP pyrophosphatase
MLTVFVKILNSDAKIPVCMDSGAAGYDLSYTGKDKTLKPFERALFGTGLALEIPPGYEGQVRPRSGLALRYGITVLNTPGTIDESFRGEVGVILINLDDKEHTIKNGDRIAQLVFAAKEKATFEEKEQLSLSERGTGGFGSTGFTS